MASRVLNPEKFLIPGETHIRDSSSHPSPQFDAHRDTSWCGVVSPVVKDSTGLSSGSYFPYLIWLPLSKRLEPN